jgi:hypothetical protein
MFNLNYKVKTAKRNPKSSVSSREIDRGEEFVHIFNTAGSSTYINVPRNEWEEFKRKQRLELERLFAKIDKDLL